MKKILIVHSDPLIRELLATRMGDVGLPVATAATGLEAWRMIAETLPDLVIVDYFLPEAQGPALLQFLRRNAQSHPVASVVFVSPLTRLGDLARSVGATFTIEETPADPASMLATLAECIGPGLVPAQQEKLTQWSGARAKVVLERIQREAGAMLGRAQQALRNIARGNRDLRSLHNFASALRPISSRAAFAELGGVHRIASAAESLAFDCHENPAAFTRSTLQTFGQTLDLLHALLAPENIALARKSRPISVFCVEDEQDLRTLIRESLESLEIMVSAVSNSREAIAHLDQKRADAILLDIGLPDVNGFELCATIRDLVFHHNTPVVFLTGRTDLQNRAQARLSGGDDFLSKPFRPMELGLKTLYWITYPQLRSAVNPGPDSS